MKTTWQKTYSFFGFWAYTHYKEDGTVGRVVYWTMFPFKYIRKIDVFWWRIE